MKLYELTGKSAELMERITECVDDGLLFEQLTDELQKVEDGIFQKAENIAKMIRTLDARAKAYKTEADFYEKKARAADKSAESLEDYLKFQMESVGIEKIQGEKLSVKVCKNGQPSLNVIGPVPSQYTIPQPAKPNNAAIKEDLLAGKTLSFAELTYGKHIRIN